ncbi:MAG TPA: hypothetical protein VNY51_00740 [Candidatus Dormibacteraeota bacterium]|jgi:hypothetical protein|nr:hypothetical protein [Candidatus Dormibacteraeota bacterium]
MKTLAASLIVIFLSHSAFGEQLKPDRVISIISLERYENDKSKGYKVEGKTSGPPIYYKLECGTSAAELEVGRLYHVAVAISPDGRTKILVFFEIHPDPKAVGMACDIESERAAARE